MTIDELLRRCDQLHAQLTDEAKARRRQQEQMDALARRTRNVGRRR